MEKYNGGLTVFTFQAGAYSSAHSNKLFYVIQRKLLDNGLFHLLCASEIEQHGTVFLEQYTINSISTLR